ncbi:hypothetical protein CDL15_Pgr009206 [Punica granatum]|uniref:Uncharacterized protein n=1 Tax=Punica granatum TaxID=22663 RepID=A0A218WWQ9_PUNGR|nr:hypothetical protein CDL15_Pgr009206 [Punica granatum]PKI59199.1 hypothetical protein CRG98_020414 [Punica granatum]
MDIGGDTSIVKSDVEPAVGDGRVAMWRVGGDKRMLTEWAAGTCMASASSPSGTWVGETQGFGSTVGPYPGGGVEFEEAQFGPLSKAMRLAMSVAI